MKRKNGQRLTKRFSASGGVAPQKVLWDFGSLLPRNTDHQPPPSPSRWDVSGKRRTTQRDNET